MLFFRIHVQVIEIACLLDEVVKVCALRGRKHFKILNIDTLNVIFMISDYALLVCSCIWDEVFYRRVRNEKSAVFMRAKLLQPSLFESQNEMPIKLR